MPNRKRKTRGSGGGRGRKKPKVLNKIFNDPIHGTIELHPLCVKIIDTVQFQRLRNIKQLGGCYFVFPGASHNRFEHSIGVSHLAGNLVRSLNEKQPDLGITKKDILCVEIAGLCHDLGHGPFSHLFDRKFIPAIEGQKVWEHEDASLQMFDHLIKQNPEVENEFKRHLNDQDKTFIKELFYGKLKKFKLEEKEIRKYILDPLKKKYDLGVNSDTLMKNVREETNKVKYEMEERYIINVILDEMKKSELKITPEKIKELIIEPLKEKFPYTYKGRSKEKHFLYEIVANKRNGIDVDKWDYFARDGHMLGFSNCFDHKRLMKLASVLTVKDGESKQICFRDKEVGNLYDMFYTRHLLHRRACQHKVNLVIERMIVEALVLANEHLKLEYKDGETTVKKKMSEAIDDMKAYEQLTDNVLYDILKSLDTNMEEARDMVKKVFERKLYKCIGTYAVPKSNEEVVKKSDDEIKEEIVARAQPGGQLEKLNLIVERVKYDYGQKRENPIESVYFYSKEDNTKAFTIPKHKVSSMLLDHFHEMEIRVYCKDEKKKDIAKKGFEKCLKKWPPHKPCQTCKST
ncbi:deoxynucleoside triphosphate triphosphohydrolase SAMHD1-like [Antedon mediterranea]|uniref:deoxynucleoside triphosphate triphosphohydrolase SAMHD1-like n=1 Tax=Antedon mediterranea TaxID=105859 RepID=UPI003AF8A30C